MFRNASIPVFSLLLASAGCAVVAEPEEEIVDCNDEGCASWIEDDGAAYEGASTQTPGDTDLGGVCQPGSPTGGCKVWGSGPFESPMCGSNTWSYWNCIQYSNGKGQKYYQHCGAQQYNCGYPYGPLCQRNCD